MARAYYPENQYTACATKSHSVVFCVREGKKGNAEIPARRAMVLSGSFDELSRPAGPVQARVVEGMIMPAVNEGNQKAQAEEKIVQARVPSRFVGLPG